MNKIYKIIWSKTVGAYVVTSELAKSHTKNPSRKELRRSIAAALMAAMVAAPVSFGVYAAGDTHYVSVKSNNQTADSNYDNQGAQAENSIAIGPSVKTTGEDNIVIGSGKLGSKKGSTSFNGQRVLVVGHGNYFQSTSDRNGQPVSYRDSAIIGHENKLLQGNADDAGGGTPAYQIVHGWKNTLKGSFTGAIGYENEIQNSSRPNHVSQNMAFAIGSENKIDATGYYMGDKNRVNTLADYKEPGENPNVVGADLYVVGRHNIIGSTKGTDWYVDNGRIFGSENVVYSSDANVFGWSNKVYGGAGAMAIGQGNKVGIDSDHLVKNENNQAIYSPVAVGNSNTVTGDYGVSVGVQAKSKGQKATAVGSTAEALSDYSAALGAENRASGYGSVAVGSLNNKYDFDNPGYKWVDLDSGKYSNAIGVMNISKGESSSAIGTKNKALGKGASSFGYLNTAAGGLSSAVGYWNKAEGEKSSSFGYLNIATGKQSSALGFRNYATAENSAAIGIYNNKYNVVKRKWEDQTAGDYSVAIGAKNHSAGNYSSALGYENMSAGSSSSAVGYRNITDADQAAAFGYANQATAQYSSATGALNQASGRYSSAIGGANQAQGTRSQALGYRNFVSGYGAVSIGSENNLNFVKQYQALGFVQTGDLSSALGISNTTAGRKSMGIGSSNYAFGTKSAGIGMNNYSMGYETLAIGHYAVAGSEDPSKIDQVKYAAAIGNRAKSTITDAVAIGSFSNTTRDKGDYGYDPSLKRVVTDADITTDTNIGTYRTELETARTEWQTSMEKAEDLLHKIHTQQYADDAEHQQWNAEYDRLNADADAKMAAYDAAQKKVSDLVGAWQGQMAALSVGDEATGRTRQITGVAAGSADTDAVNVAQLKVLNTKVDKVAANSTAYTVETKENNDNTTTVTIKSNKAGDKGTTVTVATKDIHITSGTYDKNTKKLTFTTNTNTTFDVDMNDVINATAEGGVHYLSVKSSETGEGSNYKNDGAKAKGSIVLGVRSSSEGINGVVVGNDNKLTGTKNDQNNSVVIGTGLNVDGVHNIVVGTNYENYDQKETKVKGEHNTVIGNGNLVGYTAVQDPNDATKWKYTEVSTSGSDRNVAVGSGNTANGSSVAVGTSLEVEDLGRAFGSGNKVIGSNNGGGQWGLALGSNNTVKGEMAVSVGTETNALGDYTVSIGSEAKTNASQSIAMGYQAETGKGWSAAIGSGAKTTGKASTAVGGFSASATVDYGAAFGSYSVAQRASGVAGYLANGQKTMAWKSNLGAFSVGDDVEGYSRQITGVAAGSENTDAVNVAQLRAVESKITQAGAGAQKHTSVTEGTNISVTEDGTNNEGGKNYKVSLAKDIDLGQDGSIKAGDTIINKDGVTTNTVKAGDTTINNNGLTIKDGPVITKTNVDVKNQQIHHVKDGTAVDDAATVGQVNKKIDEITKTVAGSSVTGGTIGEDGKISLTKADKTTVELQGQLKDISARAGDYEIKDNKVTIGLEDNYSKNAAGNIVIKDVAKASALEQETKERKDADKVITETIGAANKDELKTSYQNTTYIKNSTTLVEADKALDKAIGKNAGDIKKNTETINILGKQVGNLDTRVNKVGAGAAALAALHPLDFDPDDKWDFAAGYGNYKGANAAAIGAYYRPNEDTMFSVGGSFGGGENMVNAGVSVKLGRGSEYMKLSRTEMAQKLEEQSKEIREMKAKDKERDAQMQEIMRQLELLQKQAGK